MNEYENFYAASVFAPEQHPFARDVRDKLCEIKQKLQLTDQQVCEIHRNVDRRREAYWRSLVSIDTGCPMFYWWDASKQQMKVRCI